MRKLPDKDLRNSYNSRIKQAVREVAALHNLLKNIKEGKESINRLTDARIWLAKLTQYMHEASAYHNAYDKISATEEESDND